MGRIKEHHHDKIEKSMRDTDEELKKSVAKIDKKLLAYNKREEKLNREAYLHGMAALALVRALSSKSKHSKELRDITKAIGRFAELLSRMEERK